MNLDEIDLDKGADTCQPDLMVAVRNAWKSYDGTKYIFKDLSMTVYKGQIYSLLGSSGVGKTTLLKCITGNCLMESGTIDLNVDSRLKIGYMPQELALYVEMSIGENFQFFGQMLDMTGSEIRERYDYLAVLLELPPSTKILSELSGGQQRRISLAIALMKNPTFLILDEPTASVDILLKQSIWSHLKELSQQGSTILLTTHYIEEAVNSDRVGFLSNGHILQEGNPQEILSSSNKQYERLEDVYYHLCYQEDSKQYNPQFPQNEEKARKSLQEFSTFNKDRILAFMIKTFFLIRRNLLIFYLFIFCPVMMLGLSSFLFARPSGIKLGYTNYESNCSDVTLNCTTPLSCRYLNLLGRKDFILVNYNSVESGREALTKNEVWGYVRFNHNFSEGAVNRLDYFLAADPVEVSDEDEARVWLDMSSFVISYMTKKHFYDAFLDSIQEWYKDCDWNTKAAHPLIRINEPLFGKIDESLISGYVPSLSGFLIMTTGLSLGLIFVITEREIGTLARCQVSGLTYTEILIAVWMSSFLSLLPSAVILLLGMYFYTGPDQAPVFLAVVIMILQLASGIALGLLLGLLNKSVANALHFTMGLMYGLSYISGMLWPIEGFHWIAKVLFYILPSTVPLEAFRRISNKGFDKYIYSGIAHQFVWIIIIVVAIFIFFKFKKIT